MNIPDGAQAGGAIIGVGSALWGILWLRKTFSGQNVSVGKDDAERDTIKFLISERDKYMNANMEAITTLRAVEILNEKLTGKVEALTKENLELTLKVSSLDLQMRGMRKLLLSIAPDRASEIFNDEFGSPDQDKQ